MSAQILVGRRFVTGTAFHGYCLVGNLPEMPYPLTELVKAHANALSWFGTGDQKATPSRPPIANLENSYCTTNCEPSLYP